MKNEFVPRYREIAAKGVQFRGLSVLRHADAIAQMVLELKAKTVLDYGCGAGDQYLPPNRLHDIIGVPREAIALYDPAFKEHDQVPDGQFDLVVCSDVLEHVPLEDVEEFIASLFEHARLGVWASVCCRPASKLFADGTNMHVTLKSMLWWRTRMMMAAQRRGLVWALVETA